MNLGLHKCIERTFSFSEIAKIFSIVTFGICPSTKRHGHLLSHCGSGTKVTRTGTFSTKQNPILLSVSGKCTSPSHCLTVDCTWSGPETWAPNSILFTTVRRFGWKPWLLAQEKERIECRKLNLERPTPFRLKRFCCVLRMRWQKSDLDILTRSRRKSSSKMICICLRSTLVEFHMPRSGVRFHFSSKLSFHSGILLSCWTRPPAR